MCSKARQSVPVLASLLVLALGGPAPAQAPKAPAAVPAKPGPAAVKPPSPAAPPAIERDPSKLPPRVAAMRDALLDAAATGDGEKLRLVLERNEMPPVLARGQKGDPLAGLKARSGDGEARETMGILIDVLEAPYVHINRGNAQEMYVWPWFAEHAPDKLTPDQLVEVYRLLRAGEFKQSLDKKKYVNWRLGIGPDGTLHYFFTGE